MSKVADILAHKGREVHTTEPEVTVFAALEKMVRHNIGALVATRGDAVAGIFTERDLLRRVVLEGRDPKVTRVREVMSEQLVCTDPGQSVEDCMAVMTEARVRHLPVMEHGRLAGIVTIGDLAQHSSATCKVEVHYLKDYISGKYPG